MAELVLSYKAMGCNMFVSVIFLDCRLDLFLKNHGTLSDEHGERFHKDISTIERRHQGEWTRTMLVDYCCKLRSDVPLAKYSRKSSSVTFQVKCTVCNKMWVRGFFKFWQHATQKPCLTEKSNSLFESRAKSAIRFTSFSPCDNI